ncbi:MAG: hypothetical protein K2U26_05270 [Cyclobacteriaceae bacterium]|nr:hypothetical protein [Cyclobacteriaceae bacterium]
MNKKSIVQAAITGIVLGIFVIRPLSTLVHLFDPHTGDVSWSDFLANGYRQIFALNDVGPTLLSILAGIMVCVLVVMIKSRKRRGLGQSQE